MSQEAKAKTMFPSYNPGHIGVKVPLEKGLDLASRHGFGGYDPGFDQVGELVEKRGAERARELFAARGLRVGASNLPFMPYRVSEEEWKRQLEGNLPKGLASLSAIGGQRLCMWILPGHDELEYEANFEFHVSRFQPIATLAEEHGVRLALEFIGPKTSLRRFKYPFIHDLDGMRKLVSAIGHGTGLLLDSWHWHTSGGTVADLDTIEEGELAHVHINDAPADVPLEEQIDNQRLMPCASGVIDMAAFMEMLQRVSYDGPVTAEPFDAKVNALEDPEEATAINAAAVKKAFAFVE